MAILLSRGCEYGLQAVLYLATQPPNTPVLQRDISQALQIPPHFLGKILQLLSHSQVIVSFKGKSGGFCLGKPAKQITPYEIIVGIDGPTFLDGCVLGFPVCNDQYPCPVHNEWKEAKAKIIAMLQQKSIHELAKEVGSKLEFIKQHVTDHNGFYQQ